MDKKGYTDITNTVMFIFAFTVVAIVIGLSVFIFYFHNVEIRDYEARILNDIIARNILEDQLVSVNDFDLSKSINLDVINEENYFVRVEFFDESKNSVRSIFEGDLDNEEFCNLPGDGLPKCFEREINTEFYFVKIVTGANQGGGER